MASWHPWLGDSWQSAFILPNEGLWTLCSSKLESTWSKVSIRLSISGSKMYYWLFQIKQERWTECRHPLSCLLDSAVILLLTRSTIEILLYLTTNRRTCLECWFRNLISLPGSTLHCERGFVRGNCYVSAVGFRYYYQCRQGLEFSTITWAFRPPLATVKVFPNPLLPFFHLTLFFS